MKRLRVLLLVNHARRVVQLIVLAFTFAQMASVQAADWFVATNGAGGGTNWADATNSLQGAIDASSAGETVWVSNGVYDTGGIKGYPHWSGILTNRVVINKAITVRAFSANPADTFIKGNWHDGYPGGPTTSKFGLAAVRCLYMANGSSLIGFTLTNGSTYTSGDYDRSAGGVWAQSTNTVISNCVIAGNSAGSSCGGAYLGTLFNCVIAGNSSTYGGGSGGCTLYNCTLIGNSGSYGGGSGGDRLFNCTLIGNGNSSEGGGARNSTLFNCTLTGNSANLGGGAYGGTLSNCISWGNNKVDYEGTKYYSCGVGYTNGGSVSGNITNDPMFITNGSGYGTSHVAGNYRLRDNSPCLNAGTNSPWMSDPADARSKDRDGHPRIDGATWRVDMGAYEYPFNIIRFSIR